MAAAAAVVALDAAKFIGKSVAEQLVNTVSSAAGKRVSSAQFKQFWKCAEARSNQIAGAALWDLKRSRKWGAKWKSKLGIDPDGWAGGHTIGQLESCAKEASWPELAILYMKWAIAAFFDGWKAKHFYATKIHNYKVTNPAGTAADAKIGGKKAAALPAPDYTPLLLAGAIAFAVTR